MSTVLRMQDSAHHWVTQGFKITPLHPGLKIPRYPGWPADPMGDHERVEVHWTACPSDNIGIVCAGLLVLDLDRKHGDDGVRMLRDLTARFGTIGPTRAHATPTGGRHVFLRPTNPVGNRVAAFAGIDVRGDRGYVVAPPSTVPAGTYTVLADLPIATAPPWVEALFGRLDRAPRPVPSGPVADLTEVTGRVRELADELARAPEGIGNATAARISFMIGQYVGAGQLSSAAAEDVLNGALSGWRFRDRAGRTGMLVTIRRGLDHGAMVPRGWVTVPESWGVDPLDLPPDHVLAETLWGEL